MKAIRAAMMVLIAPSLGVAQGQAWPFPIQPDGTPNIFVELCRINNPRFFHAITLRHSLIFDGVRHRSRFLLPELTSYVVPAEDGSYYWQILAGPRIKIHGSGSTRAMGKPWRVKRIDDRRLRIHSNDGSEYYNYTNGLISDFSIETISARFAYNERGIAVYIDSGQYPVVALTYDERGFFGSLKAGGVELQFETDEVGQLISCTDRASHRAIVRDLRYDDDLLTLFNTGQSQTAFFWGHPKRGYYHEDPVPYHPVVIAGERYRYNYTLHRRGLAVQVINASDNLIGEWDYDARSRSVRWRLALMPFGVL